MTDMDRVTVTKRRPRLRPLAGHGVTFGSRDLRSSDRATIPTHAPIPTDLPYVPDVPDGFRRHAGPNILPMQVRT
jgi:hypothetical protein